MGAGEKTLGASARADLVASQSTVSTEGFDPSRWRPIETAPNGEDILVFCPDAKEPQIVIAALLTFVDCKDETDTEDAWHDVWMETDLDVEPTHWMPLPEPPVGK
jgi:hypothetical protein